MPSMRQLNPDLVHLIHHVELADAGWRIKLCEQLVVARLFAEQRPADATALLQWLKGEYRGTVDDSTYSSALKRLMSANQLVELENGLLQLSEQARTEAAARVSAGSILQEQAQARFIELFAKTPVGEQAVTEWPRFCSELVEPLVAELGARTYNLIAGVPTPVEGARSLSGYLRTFPEDQRSSIRHAVDAFFDPGCAESRAFLLQSLYGHLLASAASLDSQTLENIARARKKKIQLRVFVDTNFLFSLLALHDNPADEAAKELIAILRELERRIELRLYVIPLTIDETRRTLSSYESHLSAMAVTSRLGRIAIEVDEGLSGISLRYLRAARESGHRLSAQEYFRPYVEDLLPILRAKGIELFNESSESLSTEPRVIDDIVDQQKVEAHRGKKAKKYEAIRHDVTLWHSVASKRPERLDSPLEAGYWIVTIDYRFIAFDAMKQRSMKSTAPVCVHPAVLVQMLQLWLPRNAALDRAMLQGLRSMLPHPFDGEAEQVTIRILRSLSRFENVDDLPEEAIEAVLVNRALRSRMKAAEDIEEQIKLVRDAVVEEAAQVQGELEEERSRRAELERLLDARVKELATHTEEREALRASQGQLVVDLDAARKEREALAARLGSMEAETKQQRDAELVRSARVRARTARTVFSLTSLVGLSCILAAATFGRRAWLSGWPEPRAMLVMAGIWLVAILGIDVIGSRIEEVRTWPPYGRLHKARKWLVGIAGVVLVGVVVELVLLALRS